MEQDRELLVKLREAKEARGLSHQDIVNITEENGEAVSLSSVRRVFDKDSKIEDFRYKTTLRPIIRAVLGFDEENKPPESRPTLQQAEQDYTTIEALKALVEFKSEMLARVESDAQKKIDYLMSEIEKRDLIIEKKDAIIERLVGLR